MLGPSYWSGFRPLPKGVGRRVHTRHQKIDRFVL